MFKSITINLNDNCYLGNECKDCKTFTIKKNFNEEKWYKMKNKICEIINKNTDKYKERKGIDAKLTVRIVFNFKFPLELLNKLLLDLKNNNFIYINFHFNLKEFVLLNKKQQENFFKYFYENNIVLSCYVFAEELEELLKNWNNTVWYKFKEKIFENENLKLGLNIEIIKNFKNIKNLYNLLYLNQEFFAYIQITPFTFYDNCILYKNKFIDNKTFSNILKEFYVLDKNNNLIRTLDIYKLIAKNELVSVVPCIKNLLVINSKGEISQCNVESNITTYGNIFENPLDKILKSPQRLKDFNVIYKPLKVCKNCEFKNFCTGICDKRKKQFLNLPEEEQTRENCPGYYPFLKFLKNYYLDK